MKNLIITADDYGAAREVNDAVEHAHRHGILTAASLMVAAPAAADAVARAKAIPSLRVGLHLVLVEGRPVLPPASIPDLVDATGHFRTDMARAGAAMFFRPTVRRQLAAEIAAQFEAFRATGLPLDHVNTHKHFHLHPTISGAIRKIGRAHGMRAIRVPLEPRAVLAAAEPHGRAPPAYVTAPWARLSRHRLRCAGLLVPDAVFGLAWSGAMTAPRVRGLITCLPDGLSEIYLHPATSGGFAGAAPGYRYRDELAALTAPDVLAAASDPNIRLGGFADF
ncbi:ChbG/HpnK family deacetylase [Vineibacter terrae]|uniref:ChbG/HpnK family deacetylase n=1 Tax=Vineibacter terrae TaxID=2586908 RepID=A0A5C8PKU3_9HYPH|nr:hopanoid biosynthesis-associated protein HpnK [Vineibacter terrae]TXL74303.1 ChbG/HpnK family deacetylase [Vineibacter terrae]